MEYDTIIIGGGPVGGKVASEIAKENFKVLIIEEHRNIGKPIQCAGLIAPRVFDLVCNSAKKSIQNDIKGARFHSPKNNILSISSKETKAFVIDREVFDKEIVNSAIKNNVELILNSKFLSAEIVNGKVEVKFRKDDEVKIATTKILIGADGVNSKVRRIFNLSQPKELLLGFQAEVKNLKLEEDKVDVFFGRKISPNFFVWAIPHGEFARVGLCIIKGEGYPYYYFKKFMKNFLPNAKIISFNAGKIPLGYSQRTFSENVMIIGDAACQIKPTSAGGIYFGILSAKYCAETTIKALKENNFSSSFLSDYQRKWQKDIGEEIKKGMIFRKLFCKLNDDDIEEIYKILNKENIIKIIEEYGDIDYPFDLTFKILRNAPQLLKYIKFIL